MINPKNREQIVREVTPIGNGAHVFAPKEWAGEEVFIIRTPKKPLSRRIMELLEPYLKEIEGVYLYGSYARNEQRENSDIDILIIANKRFKINKKGFEIKVLEKNKIRDSISLSPILIYSALAEAKPIINLVLLNELKRDYKPKAEDFVEYIKETKNIIKINEEILDPYSIILRLRGIYLIEGFFSGKTYSYSGFKKWIFKDIKSSENIKIDVDDVYGAYLKIKNNLKTNADDNKLTILLSILKNKVIRLEKKLYG